MEKSAHETVTNYRYSFFIRVEGFNTQELVTRGSFRALKKSIKPRIQIPYKNNIPRPFRAGLLITDEFLNM